jgi:hypothetical protein
MKYGEKMPYGKIMYVCVYRTNNDARMYKEFYISNLIKTELFKMMMTVIFGKMGLPLFLEAEVKVATFSCQILNPKTF